MLSSAKKAGGITRATGIRRPRGSIGAALLIVSLLTAFLLPAAVQAAPAGTYSASSSANLLNLKLLAVEGAPALTIGQATSELASSPLSAKGAGTGLICPGVAQCATSTSQTASAPPDSDPAATQLALPTLPGGLDGIVKLNGAFGDAAAGTASGDPTGIGTGGVSTLDVVANAGALNSNAGALVQTIANQVFDLLKLVPQQPQLDTVKTLLSGILGNLVGDREIVRAASGTATAESVSEGTNITGRAEAASLNIGILPICKLQTKDGGGLEEVPACLDSLKGNAQALDPFKFGLIVVEVSAGSAQAQWLGGGSGSATADATAAIAKIKVRNLTGADPTDPNQPPNYIEIPPPLPSASIPTLFAGTPLETTITAGATSKNVTANSAEATASAATIHALKGLTIPPTTAAANDKGILLEVDALKANVEGKLPTSVLSLPKTGGMRVLFYSVAALLVVGAPLIYLLSRRLRRTP